MREVKQGEQRVDRLNAAENEEKARWKMQLLLLRVEGNLEEEGEDMSALRIPQSRCTYQNDPEIRGNRAFRGLGSIGKADRGDGGWHPSSRLASLESAAT